MITVQSPAKINLFLHVTGKRPDGYHELFTLFCCVSLFDTMTFQFDRPDITVKCTHPEVPEDETNLAYRAARLFMNSLSIHEGVAITINKRIPVAAGLGGGSSNAASVLLALNDHYDRPLTQRQLMEMGIKLGADVPFLIFRKPATAMGIGEKLSACEIPPCDVVILALPFSVSTTDIYKNFNLRLTKCKKKIKTNTFNRWFNIHKILCNDLESVTELEYPEIIRAKQVLLDHGAKGSLMSGSGPSVFGIFSDSSEAYDAADRITREFGWKAYVAKIIV